MEDHTDLALPDVIPLTLTRTYRSQDTAQRAFGIGTSFTYVINLWSAQMYQEVDLILPDSGRVHYVRTSAGTGWTDAVFASTVTPTAFYQSTITWNGNGWDLRLKDGTVYVFGDNAPLQAIRDRYGNQITITRTNGVTGNITRVTSPNGRWIAFSYDASNRITQASDNAGRTVGYQYDGPGRLWKVTDAAGGVTTYTYDTAHRLATITNPRNILQVTNQYDANGRVQLQTLANGGTYQFAYTLNGSGKVIQADVTDPRGTVRRTTFNAAGHCLSDTRAVGLPEAQTTTWTRGATSNLVLSTTDALNRLTTYTRDTAGNVTSMTRLAGTPEAVTTTSTYEGVFSQRTSTTDPLGNARTITYDAQGRAVSKSDALQHATTFVYGLDGRPTSMTDPLGNLTTYSYVGGDLTAITDALGRTTTMFLDAAGRVTSRTDPSGHRALSQYDALNRLTQSTDPESGQTSTVYDPNGNVLSVTDARSSVTQYTYTVMDQVDTRTDALNRSESHEYDLLGNRTRFTDRKGQIAEFGYDALNRLVFAGFGKTGTTYQSTISYTYDAGDRLTQVVDSAAGTIGRSYDGFDRLLTETTAAGTVSYTYDAADRRTTMTVSGQPTTTYTYDVAGRLTAIAQGASLVGFSYDAANRRTALTYPNGIAATYEYDAASQLLRMAYQGAGPLGDIAYGYDAAGDRVAIGGSWARTGLPAASALNVYDAAHQLTQWGGQSFGYDANGNMTADGLSTFIWDARNQLSAITGTGAASFQYDGLGRRSRKSLGGAATDFLYDGPNVVQELVGGAPSANLLVGLAMDETFTRTVASGTETRLVDALGSSLALADLAGIVTTQYTYESFGATTASGPASTNLGVFSRICGSFRAPVADRAYGTGRFPSTGTSETRTPFWWSVSLCC